MAGSGAGIGSGSVTFVVGNNPSSASRSGSVTIAGHSVSVNQSGIACSFTVSPTSRTVERTGGVVSISVEAPGSCPWSASAQAPWISITDGASGSGDGTVTFAIAANSAQDPRSTVITVAGHSIVVAQAPATPPAAPNGMRIIGE